MSAVFNQKFEEVSTVYGPSVWSGSFVSGWMMVKRVDDIDDSSVALNGIIPDYGSFTLDRTFFKDLQHSVGLVDVFKNTIEIKENYKALSMQFASISPSAAKLSSCMPMVPELLPCPGQNTTWGIAVH